MGKVLIMHLYIEMKSTRSKCLYYENYANTLRDNNESVNTCNINDFINLMKYKCFKEK